VGFHYQRATFPKLVKRLQKAIIKLVLKKFPSIRKVTGFLLFLSIVLFTFCTAKHKPTNRKLLLSL